MSFLSGANEFFWKIGTPGEISNMIIIVIIITSFKDDSYIDRQIDYHYNYYMLNYLDV